MHAPTPLPVPAGMMEILWRRKHILLLTVLAAVLGAALYLHLATPMYTSRSRIYVEQTGPRIIGETEQGVMTRSMNYLHTQTQLLTSVPILTAALEQGRMARMRTLIDVNSPVEYLQEHLQVGVGLRDDLIIVAFSSPFPTEAAQVVNDVVNAYRAYHTASKRGTSAEVLRILRVEEAKRRQECSNRLQELTDFRKQNPAVSLDNGQGNLALKQIERLSAALTEARLAVTRSESLYESIKAMAETPVALRHFIESRERDAAASDFAVQRSRLESDLGELQRRREDRLRHLTPEHPIVAAIDAETARVRGELSALDGEFVQSQLAAAQQVCTVAQKEQEEIAAQLATRRVEFGALNEKLGEHARLQSEYEQAKRLSDALDERIRELDATQDVGALNISVLEAACPATRPTEPQAARVLSFGLAGGLVLGALLAVLHHVMNRCLRSVEDVTLTLQLPALGAVPSCSGWWKRRVLGQVTHIKPQSAIAEAYRTVSTTVSSHAGAEIKSILVTSAVAGEGKSTLISNLAIALAQAGHRTIIVDADFRAPVQDMIFKLDCDNGGLRGVLMESLPLDEAVQTTRVDNLDVLTCGRRVANPSEVLSGRAFLDVLSHLRERYDLVLVDSPPVIPFADARILAGSVDATLLALRVEKSGRRVTCEACDALRAVRARLLGVILSDVHEKDGRYGTCSGWRDYYRASRHSRRARRWRRRAASSTSSSPESVRVPSVPGEGRVGRVDEAQGAAAALWTTEGLRSREASAFEVADAETTQPLT